MRSREAAGKAASGLPPAAMISLPPRPLGAGWQNQNFLLIPNLTMRPSVKPLAMPFSELLRPW